MSDIAEQVGQRLTERGEWAPGMLTMDGDRIIQSFGSLPDATGPFARYTSHMDRQSPLFGSRPVAFIHDEIILETPADRAPEAADRLSAVMVEGMKRFVPDVAVSADAHLMDRWNKDAEPQRDERGRLKVWRAAA